MSIVEAIALTANPAFAITAALPVAPTPPRRPQDDWPAWTDADTWTTTEDDEEPRPSWEEAFTPTVEDELYWAGFTLAMEGPAPMLAPAGMDPFLQLDFYGGRIDGMHRRWEAEDAIRERDGWALAIEGPRETDQYAPGYCS